jgi:ribonucleoside-diphosphate reductase alpha chain
MDTLPPRPPRAQKFGEWSEDALDLLAKRYMTNGEVDVERWVLSICDHISQVYQDPERAEWRSRYFEMIYRRRFLPTTVILHNAAKRSGSLAGCIVLPLSSSMDDLYQQALPRIARALLSGTGVGLDFSVLPPRLWEDPETTRACPGPVAVFSSIVQSMQATMKYAGLKRAAFMASMLAYHPDIFEFITAKRQYPFEAVNTSVAIDRAFEEALKSDGWLPLGWYKDDELIPVRRADLETMYRRAADRSAADPDLSIKGNEVLSTAAGMTVGCVLGDVLVFRAKAVLEAMAASAHACGDPGMLNLSVINESNPTHPSRIEDGGLGVGVIHTTAPCGEQPLLPNEVCHLGSFNLTQFLHGNRFDVDGLRDTVAVAVRFLDDAIDVSDYGSKVVTDLARANRKIGLGIMGLADTLAYLELPYDSEGALLFAKEVSTAIAASAEKASRELALLRGPNINLARVRDRVDQDLRRHVTLTTIAPTGHISVLADCSPGIEPYFRLEFNNVAAGGRHYRCRALDHKLAEIGYSLDDWIAATRSKWQGFKYNGLISELADDPTDSNVINERLRKLKRVFRTAHEISPKDQIRMIRTLQQSVDNGISKTINVAENATVHEVEDLFEEAIRLRVKGIAIYRDQCRPDQAHAAHHAEDL